MSKIVNIAEHTKDRETRDGRDLIVADSEFEFPNSENSKLSPHIAEKSLNIKDEFQITEIPALTVRQYILITLIIALVATLPSIATSLLVN